jgi:GTPase
LDIDSLKRAQEGSEALAIEEREGQEGDAEAARQTPGKGRDRRGARSGSPEPGSSGEGLGPARRGAEEDGSARGVPAEGEASGDLARDGTPLNKTAANNVLTEGRSAADARREPEVPPGFRCGFVAIAGEPNVGKSTLTNRLLHERLSIVTAKPQTTRRKTLGILNSEGYQAILLDTPGLMAPRYELHQAMLREARQALVDADVILFLVEPDTRIDVPVPVRECGGRRVLVLNKVDLVRRKEDLLPILTAWSGIGLFEELVPISALEGHGTQALLDLVVPRLPEGPPLYPLDELATQPERFFVGEIIRERIFERFEKEIPYATEVTVEEFHERPGAKDYVEAWIHVEQESQKAILIGADGAAIRGLGEEARTMIEEFLGRPVYLSLRVRVTPKWRKRPDALRRFGYHG